MVGILTFAVGLNHGTRCGPLGLGVCTNVPSDGGKQSRDVRLRSTSHMMALWNGLPVHLC